MAQIFDLTLIHASLPNGRWRLPLPPNIELNQEIHTVTTKVAGSANMVTEIISAENYRIRIDGMVKTQPANGVISEDFPDFALKRFVNLARAKEAVQVECDYLSFFGIRQIVLQSFSWTVPAGRPQEFRYKMVAISDDAPELQILNF